MFDFEIKVAQTKDEIEAAQRLRFEVFYLENKNLKPNRELDIDEFDKISKHLIVIDKSKNLIVGTYRLLFESDTNEIGFHSEKIFDISNIKKIKGGLLELGRSCIHQLYRNNAIINLLWNGIAWQIKEQNIKYLFGCPRLDSKDHNDISEIFALLKQKYYAPDEFRVYPHPANAFKDLQENIEIVNPRVTIRKLSPLIRGYLNVGAVVCGYPAINPEFGSVVFFMLLPTNKIVSHYRRHFLGTETK